MSPVQPPPSPTAASSLQKEVSLGVVKGSESWFCHGTHTAGPTGEDETTESVPSYNVRPLRSVIPAGAPLLHTSSGL